MDFGGFIFVFLVLGRGFGIMFGIKLSVICFFCSWRWYWICVGVVVLLEASFSFI